MRFLSILTRKMTSIDLTLNTGAKIPAVGLGTWQSPKGAVEAAVEYALTEAGVRHIDCAFAYGNHKEVGNGIAKALASGKVKREDIFITTKAPPPYHQRVEECLDLSLKDLQLDYVDLYLMHWPIGVKYHGPDNLIPRKPDGTRDIDENFSLKETWKQFEKVAASGKAKAVGVSNCSQPVLEGLLQDATVVPAVNQIECHPSLPQTEVVEYSESKGILVEAYSPFGSTGGPLFTNETVTELAKKYNTTVTSVLVSYHTSTGRIALPKTTTPARIVENSKVVDLSKEDVAKLDQVHVTNGKKRYTRPDWPVDLKFPDWNATTG